MTPRTKTKRTAKPEERLYKALSHPLRQKILIKLNERASSPSDLAVELNEKIGNVAYHVRTLLDLETIELVKTEQVRGTLEHFYRATARPFVDDAHWATAAAFGSPPVHRHDAPGSLGSRRRVDRERWLRRPELARQLDHARPGRAGPRRGRPDHGSKRSRTCSPSRPRPRDARPSAIPTSARASAPSSRSCTTSARAPHGTEARIRPPLRGSAGAGEPGQTVNLVAHA